MSYNVYIHSDNKYSAEPTDNTVNQQYAIDWSFLSEDCDYEMRFCFRGTPHAFNVHKEFQVIVMPDLFVSNVYLAGEFTKAKTAGVVGFVKSRYSGDNNTNNFMYHECGFNDNPPVIVKRPQSNLFTVKLCKDNLSNTFPNITGGYSEEYAMILNFKKIPKEYK